jgi:hypothetical protein
MSIEKMQVLTCKMRKFILGGHANVGQKFGRGKL